MATYREALRAARDGHTVTRAGRTVRFLTQEEAEPILLERMPRRTPRHVDGQLQLDANGSPIVDVHAPRNFDLRRLGLFDLSGATGPVEFQATYEDIVTDDWTLPSAEAEAEAEVAEAEAGETVASDSESDPSPDAPRPVVNNEPIVDNAEVDAPTSSG